MMIGLIVALIVHSQAQSVAAPVVARNLPYVIGYDGQGTWLVAGPACPSGAYYYSRDDAENACRLLNDADRLADRRDFNRDGFVNSQDFFDYTTAFFADSTIGMP